MTPRLPGSRRRPLTELEACGSDEVDAAVRAAEHAAPGWSATRVADRASVLERVAALIRANHESLAVTESLDTGKPLRQARADITVAARYFEYYARTCEAVFGETIPVGPQLLAYSRREPHALRRAELASAMGRPGSAGSSHSPPRAVPTGEHAAPPGEDGDRASPWDTASPAARSPCRRARRRSGGR